MCPCPAPQGTARAGHGWGLLVKPQLLESWDGLGIGRRAGEGCRVLQRCLAEGVGALSAGARGDCCPPTQARSRKRRARPTPATRVSAARVLRGSRFSQGLVTASCPGLRRTEPETTQTPAPRQPGSQPPCMDVGKLRHGLARPGWGLAARLRWCFPLLQSPDLALGLTGERAAHFLRGLRCQACPLAQASATGTPEAEVSGHLLVTRCPSRCLGDLVQGTSLGLALTWLDTVQAVHYGSTQPPSPETLWHEPG